MRSTRGEYTVNAALLLLFPLVTVFLTEILSRGGLNHMQVWITEHHTQFIVSYAIAFGLINIFYILPRRFYGAVGVVITALLSVAAFISRQKLLFRGEPLLPWDFIISKEALNITKSASLLELMPAGLWLGISLLAVVVIAGFLLLPRENYRFVDKVSTALLSLLLFVTIIQSATTGKAFSLNVIGWNQTAHYEENGLILGTILNAKCLGLQEPVCYQAETIESILTQCAPAYSVDPDFTPNIIIVMSEAFWDPTVLQGVEFSEDPLPYFHSLKQKHSNGVLLVPVYGGGTANTEFEILTGFSTRFLPQGIVPYVQFVNKPLEALPAILKRQGYEATAIHTYNDWFYRRNIVYRNLGFDRYISKNSFNNPEYSGYYIRDTELSQKILQVLRCTSKPDFVFAVSMQAHGPYSNEENPEAVIKVEGRLRNAETRNILENYTNIIHDVDKSLKLLIEELKLIDEPTVVVFLGDHLPMLGNEFDVYREAGYFENEDSYADYLNKYSVPILIWDNFSTAREDLRLSSNFLGSYILAHTMKTGSPLTDFVWTLQNKGCSVIAAPQYFYHERINEEELTQYALLQYDFLAGNEYAYLFNPFYRPGENLRFALDRGPVVIDQALWPGDNMIEVIGMEYSHNHKVYVNDIPVDTDFVNDTVLKATLPVSELDDLETIAVQVKLIDHMNNIIAESNPYYI